ncbi:hypothetical protein FA13DRAFT_1727107 [Coprinellus micaceus]|uniref:Uncharacterized protein n=1 Tax=Coprinellus micaceus TaxID=71717 RepID=A0A4Y7TRE0_COPMI|nr:hypothetical protein FA13DRAFT_1727107 [Coprinellus micaceus]
MGLSIYPTQCSIDPSSTKIISINARHYTLPPHSWRLLACSVWAIRIIPLSSPIWLRTPSHTS